MATHTSSTKNNLATALCDSGSATDIMDTLEGRKVATLRTAAGAAAVPVAVERWGADENEGMETRVIDELVVLTNAVETNLTSLLPAGALVLSVQAILHTAVAGDGTGDNLGDRLGIGITATPTKYGVSTTFTKDSAINTIPAYAILSGTEQVCVKIAKTDNSAATEKWVAGGVVRVVIRYRALRTLNVAA